MSISMGGSSLGMGPRGALSEFGNVSHSGGAYDPKVLKRLLAYLKPHTWRMLAAFALTLIESAMILAAPYLIKTAIDDYIRVNHTEGFIWIGLLILGAFVLGFVASAGQRYLITWVGQKLLCTLRQDLFNHLQRLQLGYHDTHSVGATVSKVINDVAEINELLSQGVITLVGDTLVLVGIIATMLSMNARLALLTFTVLPLMLLITWWFSRQARRAFRDTRSKVAAVVGDLAEEISGMRAIQAFAQEKATQKRFKQVNRENRDAGIRAMSLSFVFLPAIEFLSVLATAIVLWFGGRFVLEGTLTLGVMVAFLSYVSRFFQPIQELSRLYTTFQSAMAGGEQVIRLLDMPVEIHDAEGAQALAEVRGEVSFEQVSFRYREDLPYVLEDLSFRIEPGQTLAVVGQTGAGKTTIAKLLARFYEVNAGAILVDGIDIRKVKQASLRDKVRVISQDPFLFSCSIADNIRYGLPEATDAQVEEAARQANAHEFILDMPEGYQTRVQEGGINISFGQRQLISIARAFLCQPQILVLDEATANIDVVTEMLIQDALAKLLEGHTAIVIAHRLSTVRNADWVMVLDQGKIVEQGTHAELMALQGHYFRLYERQFIG